MPLNRVNKEGIYYKTRIPECRIYNETIELRWRVLIYTLNIPVILSCELIFGKIGVKLPVKLDLTPEEVSCST